jgi:3-hydroxyisobutyrate dehydrogenase-like beta-hydroxyacid dehydrogenase
MAEVALLGTGRMGAAMARRVAAAGHRLTVWNRTAASALALAGADESIAVAGEPADAVRGKDIVLVSLADGDATRRVLLNPSVLAALTPGATVCDLGTSGVAAARELATGLAAAGARFVDAPVSGSVPSVEAGTLLILASGDPDAVDVAEIVLETFASKVIRLGPAGAGQAMKLAVNLIVHSLNAAVAEALVLATRAGITAEAAYDVFEASVVGAPFVRYKRAAFLDPQAPVAMSLALVDKDLRLIRGLADQLGLATPVTSAAATAVAEACAAGLAERDMAALGGFLADSR